MSEFDIARTERKARSISLVPLINVVFMLVFFFLVGGHLEKVSIVQVDLPVADSGQYLDEGPVEVILGKYNEILINDNLVAPEQLASVLQQELAVNPERIITIKADAFLEANKLVEFLEVVGNAGGKNLSVVTQSGEGAGR
jgi:biopolymer transport protein ExbD